MEDAARGLMSTLSRASSAEAVTACLEALNQHLIRHPGCKAVMWQVGSRAKLSVKVSDLLAEA